MAQLKQTHVLRKFGPNARDDEDPAKRTHEESDAQSGRRAGSLGRRDPLLLWQKQPPFVSTLPRTSS